MAKTMQEILYGNQIKSYFDSRIAVPEDRYALKTRLVDTEDRIVIRPVYKRDLDVQSSPYDIFHLVTVQDEFRPDILALDYYGDANLYWVILARNDLDTWADVKEGMSIVIPDIGTQYMRGGVMLR